MSYKPRYINYSDNKTSKDYDTVLESGYLCVVYLVKENKELDMFISNYDKNKIRSINILIHHINFILGTKINTLDKETFKEAECYDFKACEKLYNTDIIRPGRHRMHSQINLTDNIVIHVYLYISLTEPQRKQLDRLNQHEKEKKIYNYFCSYFKFLSKTNHLQ